MRASAINRQFMANTGDRLAGRSTLCEPRRLASIPCHGAQLPDGDHAQRPPSGLSSPTRSSSLAAVAGAGAPLPPAPAELTVPMPGHVMLMLRLAASAAGISAGEAVQRAICRYADSLGLQVLADAVAFDPDLAVDFARARTAASRLDDSSVCAPSASRARRADDGRAAVAASGARAPGGAPAISSRFKGGP